MHLFKKAILISSFLLCQSSLIAQFSQIGDKLIGTGATTTTGIHQGYSVSLSADGKVALVGGEGDGSNTGAVWVYTFNGTNFIQLGNKLMATDAVGSSKQGWSVCLSADGKTAIVGGPYDNSSKGAAWIFTFNGNDFVQLGSKLIGTSATGPAMQGSAVSLSADGKTAFVGGMGDNSYKGAVWVYTFNGTNFVQFGNKLVGTGGVSVSTLGNFISTSADGKVVFVAGNNDNSGQGAVWVYTFNGSNYMQAGNKLVGSGSIGAAYQGITVSTSSDGKTALVGGYFDDSKKGAVWVYTFNGSNYIQLGNKIVSPTAADNAQLGIVSLSSDGKIALIGGNTDNTNVGAAWIYTYDGSGFVQAGNKIVGAGSIGTSNQGTSVSLSIDGKVALLGGPGDNSNHGAAWAFAINLSIAGNNTTTSGSNTSTSGSNTTTSGTNTTISGSNTTIAGTTSNPNATLTGIINSQNAEGLNFEIYPNPANDTFTLVFNDPSNEGCLVYNSLGQYITTLQAGKAILPKGLYLLRIGKNAKKLIVE